jgi:hypothetical protein
MLVRLSSWLLAGEDGAGAGGETSRDTNERHCEGAGGDAAQEVGRKAGEREVVRGLVGELRDGRAMGLVEENWWKIWYRSW